MIDCDNPYTDILKIAHSNQILNFSAKKEFVEIYQNIGIDLRNDNNFVKYELKTFETLHMSIFCDVDNRRLIDARVVDKFNRHFIILSHHRLLLDCLNHLFIKEKMIGEISFRIENIVDDGMWMFDAFDFGTKLKVDIDDLPKISKFYNLDNSKDNFWVFHDNKKKQISFEELCDDFKIFNDDVVTQLIHLEYEKVGNEYFITHIDHEYIIYTFDEYESRLSDNSQKGYKKVKTFKVDNAKIPFFYQYETYYDFYEKDVREYKTEYFLYIVLDSFFKHKELLKEYFEDINKERK